MTASMMFRRPGAVRVLGWQFTAYKRLWKTNVISQVVQPLLYLLGLGIGVGQLVDDNVGAGSTAAAGVLGGVSYVAFVAPGLLVTNAMSLGAFESMWPVMGGLKWDRSYHAMNATPLDARDIVGGQALWMFLRACIAAALTGAIMALFPELRSIGLLAVVPICGLVAMAFAMPIMAYAVTAKYDGAFAAVQRFVIIPLFLFGGAFYPLSQLPTVVQWVAQAAPLWHGVELARATTQPAADMSAAAAAGHIAYLAAWAVVGSVVAARRLHKVLYV